MTDANAGRVRSTGLIQGFGIGCVFVPLGAVAFATIAPALRTQGTGLFILMRIGASIGTSIMSYLLVRNSTIPQAALVEHVTPYRQVVSDHAHQLSPPLLADAGCLPKQ